MKLQELDKCIYKYPDEWRMQKLSEGANIQSGYAFKKSDFYEYGVPVIKIKNIEPPNIVLNDVQYVSDCLAEEKKLYQLNYNDILISLTGSNVNQFASAVGKVGRVKIKNKKMVLNQRVGRFLLKNPAILDYDFLYHYISTEAVQYELASSAAGSANQANISPSQILSLTMPYPPLPEQRAIAEILSSIDDKIELNNQMNRTLEATAQAIFKQWFVDFEFPFGYIQSNPFEFAVGESIELYEQHPSAPLRERSVSKKGSAGTTRSLSGAEMSKFMAGYKSSGGKMIDSELGPIPEGWRVGFLSDIVEITSGKRPKEISDIKTSLCCYPLIGASKIMGYVSEWLFDERILVIGRVGTHGVIQRFSLPTWPSDNTLVFKSDYYNFSYQILNNVNYSELNRGSTQPLITQTDMKNIKILIPDKENLIFYETVTNSMFDKIDLNNKETKTLSTLRDSLLPKLMSGELRVPEEIVKSYEDIV